MVIRIFVIVTLSYSRRSNNNDFRHIFEANASNSGDILSKHRQIVPTGSVSSKNKQPMSRQTLNLHRDQHRIITDFAFREFIMKVVVLKGKLSISLSSDVLSKHVVPIERKNGERKFS